ncbi:hypothetical protein ONA91_15380 [Micromonospora sp. DR5-3]|uniref:hypothetical protein n=1 Tax=unclassified Micromonospora TaxID=2617518 RepID=UPI0011D54521|nr:MULTISPECIES: hypothetical protein [unclassified Micromonospora]MCW3815826.1 hypothetical protein [Micromonospora sp. DR5-3]TYC21191.1 hypothetical protein FXF52_27110 [Micromonospora sp. MP36]
MTVHAPLQLEPGRGFQFIEFAPGVTGVIESGRVMEDVPAVRKSGNPPPELGYDRAGENPGGDNQFVTRDAGEQAWFRETFCNGAQHCVQGWDWAFATSTHKLGNGTGIAMVGREGTVNGRFLAHYWECVCSGPFCVGGTDCFWIEFWSGLILPGHWVSIDTSGGAHYIKWSLEGAGPNTQVSLAARY